MSSSVHVDNKGNHILILGKSPTQRLVEHSLSEEKKYSINFTVTKKQFCLSLHCEGGNSYCLSMVQKFTNLRQTIQKLFQLHYA